MILRLYSLPETLRRAPPGRSWISIFLIIFTLVISQAIRVPPHAKKEMNKQLMLSTAFSASDEPVEQSCDKRTAPLNWFIYCSGRILEAVNIHSIFNDSKTFVDMPLRDDPGKVVQSFNEQFKNISVTDMKDDDIKKFLKRWFSEPGTEMVSCTPVDWKPRPSKLEQIQDPKLRAWAYELHGIWKKLCRKLRSEIHTHPERHSLIGLPNPFIIPGGRFKEFYYWDTYWIVKGLLVSEMYTTVKQMIENLAHLIRLYGFVPNGGRIYYLRRSQPPVFSAMVYEYYESTHDKEFVFEMLPVMERELEYFNTNKMVNVTLPSGETFEIYRYYAGSNVPRPESYREDIFTAIHLEEKDRPRFWRDVASAAESGWDFSTRWFKDSMTLIEVQTTSILPVDLNALQCWSMDIMEYLYERIGNKTQSEFYREKRARFRDAVHHVFYNNTAGSWFDYNIETGLHNTNFYPSNALPLFTGCYHSLNQGKSARFFTRMQDLGVFNWPGGIPTSLINGSNEQWDFPNGFSNLNHMIIEGLRKSENPQMQDQAFKIAQKWVLGNFKVFQETKVMWEKYNVIGDVSKPGSGGEYDVQEGFGWSNGVILDLLLTYSDRLAVPTGMKVSPAWKNWNYPLPMSSYSPERDLVLSLMLLIVLLLLVL